MLNYNFTSDLLLLHRQVWRSYPSQPPSYLDFGQSEEIRRANHSLKSYKKGTFRQCDLEKSYIIFILELVYTT